MNLMYLYNQVNITFYVLQHLFYKNLSIYYDQFNLLKLFSLVSLGIFTSITPCFISVLPLILSSTLLDNNFYFSTKIVTFIGLLSSFILIIFIVFIGNYTFFNLFSHFPLISGLIFISIALNLLGVLRIAFFVDNLSINYRWKNSYLRDYLVGFSLGFSSLPCNCSIILTTILWVYNEDKIIESLIYLFIYLLGCLLPFIIIFLLPFQLLKLQKFIYLWDYITPLAGVYILTFGFFILFQELLSINTL